MAIGGKGKEESESPSHWLAELVSYLCMAKAALVKAFSQAKGHRFPIYSPPLPTCFVFYLTAPFLPAPMKELSCRKWRGLLHSQISLTLLHYSKNTAKNPSNKQINYNATFNTQSLLASLFSTIPWANAIWETEAEGLVPYTFSWWNWNWSSWCYKIDLGLLLHYFKYMGQKIPLFH